MIDGLFASFRPNADELLRRVSHHVDNALLDVIATADYRGRDAEEHLAHLRQIRDQGLFAVPMRWCPREVLELIRWSQPEDPSWKPGLPGEPGHWMRAFACAALLKAAADAGNEELRGGWNQTLIQLIGSLRAVAPELYEPAAAFLAWLISQVEAVDGIEELGFLLVGLLWLALHLPIPLPEDVVVALCERITAEAQRAYEEDCGPKPERWLLGTTYYDGQHEDWERLGQMLTAMDLGSRSPAVREWVRLIGSELAQGLQK